MIYLDLEDVLHIAERVLPTVQVRDAGLLESALARPRAIAFGYEAYPGLAVKAGALLHSLARHHPLVDGNERLALAAVVAFLGINSQRLPLGNDEAYDLVVAVASGEVDSPEAIAERLHSSDRRGRR